MSEPDYRLRARRVAAVGGSEIDKLNASFSRALVGNVLEIIRQSIAACECAVVVISGKNANVMYELGLVHALDKPTLLVCERASDGSLPELPFDLRTQDVVGYSMSDLPKLRRDIGKRLATAIPLQ